MLTRVARQLFSRRRRIALNRNIQEDDERKQQQFQQILKKSWTPVFGEHQQDIRTIYLYGKQHYISSMTPHNIESMAFTMGSLKFKNPEILLLGGMSPARMDILMSESYKPSPEVSARVEDLFCKQKFQTMQKFVLPVSETLYLAHHNNYCYSIYKKGKYVTIEEDLAAGLYSLQIEDCRLLYGIPHPLVVMEDLILSCSLEELKEHFIRVIQRTKEHINQQEQTCHFPNFVAMVLQENAKTHAKQLFNKQVEFSSALFRKSCRLHKMVYMITPHQFIKDMEYQAVRGTREPEDLFRGYVDDPSHNLYQSYDKLLKQRKIGARRVLQKLVILNYLISDEFNSVMLNTPVIAKQMLDNTVFASLFKDMSAEQIQNTYLNIKKPYSDNIYDLQTLLITNQLTMPVMFSLPEKLTVNEQLIEYVERLDRFPTLHRADSNQTMLLEASNKQKIHETMLENLLKEGRKKDYKMLTEYLSGTYTPENIVFYTKYFGEVNITLGSPVRLPVFHFGNFSGYFKEVLKQKVLDDSYLKTKGNMYLTDHSEVKNKKPIKLVPFVGTGTKQDFDRFLENEHPDIENLDEETEGKFYEYVMKYGKEVRDEDPEEEARTKEQFGEPELFEDEEEESTGRRVGRRAKKK